MLKHIVLFRLKGKSKGQINNIINLLKRLKKQIDIIQSVEVGFDIIQQERSYDIAFIGIFRNFQDLEIYQKHPEHIKLKEYMEKVSESIVSVDFECSDE